MNKAHGFALIALVASGCSRFDEHLVIRNLEGQVVLPAEAATRTFTRSDGTTETITDVRLIGPVYLGLYPSVREGIVAYPHPEIGPVFEEDTPGDTYPYGGTSLGDIRFPCMEYLKCKVVSGRYVDFDEMVTWFNDVLEQPILDANGDLVETGDYIAETCFDLLNYVDESEIRLTATEDVNGDGNLDAQDLDFVQQSDGTFAADFTIWQQEYFENEETGTGFTLWGWMDAPSERSYQFTTCDSGAGQRETEYTSDFYGGRPYNDLLNFPSSYIYSGDWVASEGYTYQTPDDAGVVIQIDTLVGGQL